MSTFSPWQFTSPYISYTPILAVEMNGNLSGISASFLIVGNELNNFRPRLPDNFTGNVAIPEQPYYNTLLCINEQGNMDLLDRGAFQLAIGKDLTVTKSTAASITVSGNDHATLFYMQHESTDPEGLITVAVGAATALVEGTPAVAPGSIILFTQASPTSLVFVELEGVTINPPKYGLLKAYGEGCTVGLIAIDETTWQLVGDVYLDEAVVL